MHSRAVAERKARAQRQSAESAAALAKSLGLDESLVEGLNVKNRDPQVQSVLQAEKIADLLDAAAKAAKSLKGQLTKAKKAAKELKAGEAEAEAKAEEEGSESTEDNTEETTEDEKETAAKDGE